MLCFSRMTTTCIILIVVIASLAQIKGETSKEIKKKSTEVDKGPTKVSEDSVNERCNRDVFNMFDMDRDGQITIADLENCKNNTSEYMKIEIEGWDEITKRNILKNMEDITRSQPCNGRMNFTFFKTEIMEVLEKLGPLTQEQETDMILLRRFQLPLKEWYTLEEVVTASNHDEDTIRQRYGLIYGGLSIRIPRKDLVRALRNSDRLPLRPIEEVGENIVVGCSILIECLEQRRNTLKERILAKASEIKGQISKAVEVTRKKLKRKSVANKETETGPDKKNNARPNKKNRTKRESQKNKSGSNEKMKN